MTGHHLGASFTVSGDRLSFTPLFLGAEPNVVMTGRGEFVDNFLLGLFFEQPVGSIEGPFRGPHGYYITRVVRRTPPNRLLDLSEPVHRQLLEQHHLSTVLKRTAWELLNEGLKDGSVQGVEGV